MKLVPRLELPLGDLPGADGDLPALEIDVRLEGGAESSALVTAVGDWVIGEFGPLE